MPPSVLPPKTIPGKGPNLTPFPAPDPEASKMAEMAELTDADFEHIFAPLAASEEEDAIVAPRKKSIPQVKMSLPPSPVNEQILHDASMGVGAGAAMISSAPATISDRDERYDETILLAMRKDEALNPADRKMLEKYHGLRREPGKARIRYTLSKNCEDHNLGRLMPEHALGLQGMRFDVRNALAHKYYWDIDIENAHYNIALSWCKRYGLKCEAIQHYITNRKACLETVSSDRWFAKVAFIKILYGGDISLYDPLISEPTGASSSESIHFQMTLRDEVQVLAEFVWIRHPQFHKVKSGKEGKPLNKQSNNHFKLLSLLFQREERSCLLALDAYLSAMGRTMSVLIHDGGLVTKLEGELEFPTALLRGGEDAIAKATGYSLVLTNKPMVSHYTPPTITGDAYAVMKADFDRTHFMVGSILNCLIEDGTRQEMKWGDAMIQYANLTIPEMEETAKGDLKIKMRPFMPKWLADKERPSFIKCDFVPNRAKCPASVYNLFHGFEAETLAPIPEEEVAALIQPILYHMDRLTSGHADHFLKWLANLFQNPDVKSDTSILFRDMGGLLFEGGGTGKNLFFDWIGRKILGSDYYVVVGDNSTLYSSFNSVFEGKLLVFVEEAAGKDNHSNTDRLQSKITSRKTIVNKKCVAEREMNDYARYCFGSNNANPLPSKGGMSRRQWMFDSDTTHRGDKAYFEALVTAMDDPRVQRAFFQFLMATPTWKSPIEFFTHRPITDTYIHIRQMNAPLHHKWLCHELRRGTLPKDESSRALYHRFKEWALASGERKADTMPTETAFGKLMNEAYAEEEGLLMEAPSVTRKSGGLMLRTFDIPKLIRGLVQLHFLREGEIKVEENGDLIEHA